MRGEVCGPGLWVEHVTSACVLLAGTQLFGPSAKGLETTVSLCVSEENQTGLVNTLAISARVCPSGHQISTCIVPPTCRMHPPHPQRETTQDPLLSHCIQLNI